MHFARDLGSAIRNITRCSGDLRLSRSYKFEPGGIDFTRCYVRQLYAVVVVLLLEVPNWGQVNIRAV